jgi:hypothetical protein
MSLREQLFKAGLVTAEQIKQAETEAKKKTHQSKKDKALGAEEAARKAAEQRQRQEEAARKRERDRALNEEREAIKRRRENAARVRQLIATNRVNDAQAQIRYNFQAGRVVRSVRVTPPQQRLLAQGRLGIVRNPHDEFDFPIVPRDTADKLAAIDPALVLLLYEESTQPDDDDWG